MMWSSEPKNSIETRKLIVIVLVIRTANFWKVTTYPPNKKAPEPNVVMVPLKMLTPISE